MKMQQKKQTTHSGERGYLLVGLLAFMTISLITLAAAAPELKFQSQREREEEMLWRGQQIVIALTKYSTARAMQFPNSLEELVEGVNLGVKKVRFLRPHALCDPMYPCTPGKSNWRLVHPGDPVITSMLQSLQAYQQKQKDNPQLAHQLQMAIGNLQRFAPRVLLPGQGSSLGGGAPVDAPKDQDPPNNPNPNNPNNPSGSGDSLFGPRTSDQGPVIGVVSRSGDRPIRTILDIENYDKELFYAGGIVLAGGFYTPFYTGGTQAPATNPCPNGGFMLPDNEGKMRCFGGLIEGPRKPSDRGKAQ
jgi:type II secretory pathway pseudopilin PulG